MGSSSTTTGYKYYIDLHLVAGLGNGGSAPGAAVPDCLLQFLAGDRIAWNGLESGICKENGTIQVSAPDLFGGDEKEGGIVGTLEVQFGGTTQGVNGYLLSKFGTPQSGNRGVFSVVWQGGQVCSNNPYIKPWAFLRRRITGDWAGGCWHEAKAPIPLEGGSLPTPGVDGSRWAFKLGGVPLLALSPDGLDWSDTGETAAAFYSSEATILFGETLVSINAAGTSKLTNWASPGGWVSGPSAGAVSGILNPYLSVINGRLWVVKGSNGVSYADSASGGYTDIPGTTTAIAGNSYFVVRFRTASLPKFIRSLDNGTSWSDGLTIPSSPIPGDATYEMNVFSADGGETRIAFGGTNAHIKPFIFWSEDGFLTQTASILPVGLSGTIREIIHISGEEWVALMNGTGGGWGAVLVSFDDCETFTAADLGEPVNPGGQIFLGNAGYDLRDGRFLCVAETADGNRIFQSDDRITWNKLTTAAPFDPSTIYCIAVQDSGSPGLPGRYCMNPAHIIYQCITEPGPGLGYDRAVIDDANFRAVADALYAEGLGLNLVWTKQDKIETFIKVVCDHAGMILLQDRRTGLWKLRLLRQDYSVDDLRVFTPSNCRIVSKQRPSPADLVNALDVTYTDYKTGKEATVPVREPAAVQALGRVVKKAHSLTGLPTESLALRCGERDLAAMCKPLWRFDLQFLRDADTLEIGEPFVLDWPPSPEIPEGLYVILRAADEIDYGSQTDGRISAKCVEDVFDLPNADAVYGGPMGPYPGGPSAPLRAESMLIEAPYRDLSQKMRADDLAALPDDAGYVGAVAVAANSGQMSYELHTRIAPADFAKVALGDYAGSGLLSAGVLPLDAAISLSSEVDTSRLAVGDAAFLGNGADAEMVRINVVYPGVIGAQRGCGDTVPREWPAGTRLWGYDNYTGDDPNQYVDGETVDAKVLSRTASGVAADAPVVSVTLNSRATRPYPPGNVRVNGELVLLGDPSAPTPSPAPGGGGSGTSPLGVPASTSPGPNGGFPDTGVPPTPLPSATGDDEVGADGDFSNPAALASWTDQLGNPLDPLYWSVVGGKLTCRGVGLKSAFYRGAEQRMPFLPFPRYTATAFATIETDTGVEAAVGIGIAYDHAQGGQPGLGNSTPLAEFPVEAYAEYVHDFALSQASMSPNNYYIYPRVMPMLVFYNSPFFPEAEATFNVVGLTVDPVPAPTTAQPVTNLDFSDGMNDWSIWPYALANDYFDISVVTGGLSVTSKFEYSDYCIFFNEDPLTMMDIAGKYAQIGGEVWSNDPTLQLGRTTGGVAFGLISKSADGAVLGGHFSCQERGDWTARENWVRAFLANGTSGITIHAAVRMKQAPGKTSKFRNLFVRVTDDVQD